MTDIFAFIGNYFIVFLIILTFLVFVHELGHYYVAKHFGVKIETFSIGFGPEIFGWTDKSGTRWRFSWIPLGGYVNMFGDADPSSRPSKEVHASKENKREKEDGVGDWAEGVVRPLTKEEKSKSFHHKPLGQRALIVAAGPLVNFIFAIILMVFLFVTYGQPTTPPIVGGVIEDSPAAQAGIEPGDRIVAINGQEVNRFEQVQFQVLLNLDEEMNFTIQRGSEDLTLALSPQIIEVEDANGQMTRVPRLGIMAANTTEFEKFDLSNGLGAAVSEAYSLTKANLIGIYQIIVGDRPADQMGGIVRVAELSGQAAEIGFASIIWLMALLSLNLGLINLFPIPMLDGGHLLFYGFEAILRRPLSERIQEIGFRIGFAFVVFLMIFVTWNDISRLGFFDFLNF